MSYEYVAVKEDDPLAFVEQLNYYGAKGFRARVFFTDRDGNAVAYMERLRPKEGM